MESNIANEKWQLHIFVTLRFHYDVRDLLYATRLFEEKSYPYILVHYSIPNMLWSIPRFSLRPLETIDTPSIDSKFDNCMSP